MANDNEFKMKVAKTLINMYGDKILSEMYMQDENLSELARCEMMLDEILHDMKVRHVRCLKDGD